MDAKQQAQYELAKALQAYADLLAEQEKQAMTLADVQKEIDALVAQHFPKYAGLLAQVEATKGTVSVLETQLREMALSYQEMFGEAHPFGGVLTVRETVSFELADEVSAIEWARAERPELLKIDTTKLKKAWQARSYLIPEDVVRSEVKLSAVLTPANLFKTGLSAIAAWRLEHAIDDSPKRLVVDEGTGAVEYPDEKADSDGLHN